MFSRKIYPALKEHLQSPHITVLTGMRRTGKTTTLKYLMGELNSANKLYIDFERLDNRELFSQKNYDTIANNFEQSGLNLKEKAYLFMDEIQLVKNLPSVIKYLYDHYGIKFVVTGSSSYYLKNLFSESLSGRKKIFELYTLDFFEFLDLKKYHIRPLAFLIKNLMRVNMPGCKNIMRNLSLSEDFPKWF